MEQTYKTKHIIISIFIVVAVIVLFYGLTVLLVNNKKEKEQNNNDIEKTVIQYDEILVGEIYSQKENEYYVLAYTSDNSQKYISKLNEYNGLENSIKTYQINLASGFNKKYVSETNNFDSEYPMFGETTLLKITDKQITEKYTGNDIMTKIESLINN